MDIDILPNILSQKIKFIESKHFATWKPAKFELPKITYVDPFRTLYGEQVVTPRLTSQQEHDIFIQMNWTKKKCCELVEKYKKRKNTFVGSAIIKTYLEWVTCEEIILNTITGLVLKFYRKNAHNGSIQEKMEFQSILSEGNYALLRAIRGFNVDFGWKFSTYAVNVITRGFARVYSPKNYPKAIFQSIDVEDHDFSLISQFNISEKVETKELIDLMWVALGSCKLNDDEDYIIRRRYLAVGNNIGQKILGKEMGISTQRIQQIEAKALKKIRLSMTTKANVNAFALT